MNQNKQKTEKQKWGTEKSCRFKHNLNMNNENRMSTDYHLLQ